MSTDQSNREPIDSALWTGRQPSSPREFHAFRLVVDYSKGVTVAEVRRVDDLLREEFATGDWVDVETETFGGKLP